ncbi:hypothetical protein ACOMHN_002280 [Nucella lapillus]
MAPRKQEGSSSQGRGRNPSGSKDPAAPKDNDDYKKRRERNNIAVRKSRQLSRQKAKVMEGKVNQLRSENKNLEEKVKLLSKELCILKDLFMSSAVPATDGQASVTAEEAEVLDEIKMLDADHEYSPAAPTWDGGQS